jgi:CRP/FNR family transcriptional regulator
MISAQHQSEFEHQFPFIRRADADFVTEFYSACSHIELPAGVSICDEGEHCAQLSLLLDGVGRVYKLSPGGREVTLYRVFAGEACVLTASCIMNQDSFPAMAVTETPVRAIVVSPDKVRKWICDERQWQHFIFGLLSHRLANIIAVVEEVAFKRMDVRLAEKFARSLEQGKTCLKITHAELAADVGSSREVVSRILKDFADRGMIETARGSILLTDPAAIEILSRQ